MQNLHGFLRPGFFSFFLRGDAMSHHRPFGLGVGTVAVAIAVAVAALDTARIAACSGVARFGVLVENDEIAQHLLVEVQAAIEFVDGLGIDAHADVDVRTFGLLVDVVRELAPAPVFVLRHFAAMVADDLDVALHALADGGLVERWIADIDELVLTHPESLPHGLEVFRRTSATPRAGDTACPLYTSD